MLAPHAPLGKDITPKNSRPAMRSLSTMQQFVGEVVSAGLTRERPKSTSGRPVSDVAALTKGQLGYLTFVAEVGLV